jgi:hypothetical protein
VSETDLVRNVLSALQAKRVWAWRANSGTMVVGQGASKYVVRGAPAGTPDILVVLPCGRLCGLECKVGNGKQRPTQVLWQRKAERSGVGYAVVRSVSEALLAVERWSESARVV